MDVELDGFFARLAGLPEPARAHPWQLEVAGGSACTNRLIRIPTGMGKTHGVLAAWLWNRVQRQDPAWPRRLVWCLPMRVLVEQVADEIERALRRIGPPAADIAVHALMGGTAVGQWQVHPERDAVLVGTQDMLLSRALNRGYGASRARWPMEFGLLNQDCLWVMDEVQLMDVGLATSAQLQAFREDESAKALRPCKTWWMSATLQPQWLERSPDTAAMVSALESPVRVPPAGRLGPLWEGVDKPVALEQRADARQVAALVVQQHQALGGGSTGPTLVVLNTVKRAVEVRDAIHKLLSKGKPAQATDLQLVHSRFRPAERTRWRSAFLSRQACGPGSDRIVVATQVVEAGVDMSSSLLVTDLAPWPSLVQRFGRAARWGGRAQVIVLDNPAQDDKAAAPYTSAELDAARKALGLLEDVSPRSLEAFEEQHPELLHALYPYQPAHLLLRQEVDDLFDTAADLSGADIDISRFIRSGDERDVQVFWREIEPKAQPDSRQRAAREELCAVPFLQARDWLCNKDRRKPDVRAWVWDWLAGAWRLLEARDIYPGQTLLVAADVGGYDPLRGWDPKAPPERLRLVSLAGGAAQPTAADIADDAESDESLSATAQWQTIAFHGLQVGRQAGALAQAIAPRHASLFDLAGRWHDAGKAHAAFQASIKPHRHGRQIAKAPKDEWHRGTALYRLPDGSQRAGFRHELASTLALFALIRRCQPDHPALLGPWRALLVQIGRGADMPPPGPGLPDEQLTPLEREVLVLGADDMDLLLYLVCSHHGKVRMSWQASPADQSCHDATLRIRGVRSGDILPAFSLAAADGQSHAVPETELVLAAAAVGLNPHTGRSWTERVLGLLARHGPFVLAWLEAVMRAADQRASADATLADPALEDDNAEHGRPGDHPPLAGTARSGEASPPLGQHPAQRGAQHGAGRRAGGPGDPGSRTRASAHATPQSTRYLETQLGRLSYAELAPHLARGAAQVEADIQSGVFDDRTLDDKLIQDLHRRLCAHLTPQLAGWRRVEVLVGTHTPPPPHLVSLLMHEYALNLQARIAATPPDTPGIFETLAFAEGRLLSIHPFADFNGRVSRLFLRLLLRRLDLPDVDIVPDPDQPEPYFQALRAADLRDWRALASLWRQRVELTQGGPAR
jgi:CRISPR-associated endonuclease/helicase Cas3